MRIHVEGNYYISGDAMDYKLEQEGFIETGRSKGDKKVSILGYYPSVSSCMKALLQHKIGESTATDLKGLMTDVARIEAELKALIQF